MLYWSLFLLSVLNVCFASNILVMLPMPMYSHVNSFTTICNELANRGHNVTLVSAYPPKHVQSNLKHILTENFLEKIWGNRPLTMVNGMAFHLFGFWYLLEIIAEGSVKQEAIQKLIQDKHSSYDLVILETFSGQEPLVAFGHRYNAPVINFHSFAISSELAQYTGNPSLFAYMPSFKLHYTDKMTLLQRATNTLYEILDILGSHFYHIPKMESLMKKYFTYPGSENLPPLADLLKNTSLTLTETNLAMRYPRPLQNNVIEIGGFNLKDGDKLPNDLKKFMDEAPDGVVYFSFGSHFKTTSLDKKIRSAFLSAFGKLKQKVLMKWDDEQTSDVPKNIKFVKWAPQASILGHPNCKVFVTHGGAHGVTEGLYYGVPMIGMPLFGDQSYNLIVAENFGAAIILDFNTITTSQIFNAVNTILTNKQYQENAAKRKALLRDHPIHPLDKAIFWIEYVIRHRGAPHLSPAVLDLPIYQYLLIDVFLLFAVLLAAILFILATLASLLLKIVRFVFKTKQKIKESMKLKKK